MRSPTNPLATKAVILTIADDLMVAVKLLHCATVCANARRHRVGWWREDWRVVVRQQPRTSAARSMGAEAGADSGSPRRDRHAKAALAHLAADEAASFLSKSATAFLPSFLMRRSPMAAFPPNPAAAKARASSPGPTNQQAASQAQKAPTLGEICGGCNFGGGPTPKEQAIWID